MKSGGTTIGMLAAGLLFSAALAPPALAVDPSDHDRARKALEAGEILPLRTVLEKVDRDTPGQVMEVELERKNGRWIYEIKLLRPGGALVKLLVDASNGSIIAQRERDAKPSR